eukprot:TRINITY_DN12402_c0_g1_i1.p1 TRINITY_DN12402_c0_g1~~TRINITY_DN12402_c0_g1_i1.p1  ORF type:complete len:169 (-),score=40.49 TRINITY_DN12402_c0_g1_i1:24-530(-)
MIPKQIIPGASTGSASTFSYGKISGEIYLAYASKDTVIITTSSLKVIHILGGHDDVVTCISWSSLGTIAAGSGQKVVLYSPDKKDVTSTQHPKWRQVCEIQLDHPVTAMSWMNISDFIHKDDSEEEEREKLVVGSNRDVSVCTILGDLKELYAKDILSVKQESVQYVQ